MAQWGEITVECDCKGCEAVQHFTAADLIGTTLGAAKTAAGWRWFNYHDVCPQCEEERERAIAERYTRAKPREADAATR
jgi:hypothetical protein